MNTSSVERSDLGRVTPDREVLGNDDPAAGSADREPVDVDFLGGKVIVVHFDA